MGDAYLHWNSAEAVKKYAKPRLWKERFRSEVFFLDRIMRPGMSILDVGCAAGDLYHGLKEKYGSVRYVGVDVAESMINHARSLAGTVSDAEFIAGNLFDLKDALADRMFDVVTATGVFQHEPKYRELLRTMAEMVRDGGYILFDVKLFRSHPTLCDISRSYVDHPDPLYFIVLNMKDLVSMISDQPKICDTVEVFGYYSGIHKAVRLPSSVHEQVCSSHILLKKKAAAPAGSSRKFVMMMPHEFSQYPL